MAYGYRVLGGGELDQREFVNAVMKRLGYTPTELGTALGKRNAYNAVNSWISDKPSNFRKVPFADVIRMLELCGWIDVSQTRPAAAKATRGGRRTGVVTPLAQPAQSSSAAGDLRKIVTRLEALEGRVEKAGSAATVAIERLADEVARLASLLDAQAGQASPGAATK